MDPYDQFASGYLSMGDDPVSGVDPSGGSLLPTKGVFDLANTMSQTADRAITLTGVVVSAAKVTSHLTAGLKLMNIASKVFTYSVKILSISDLLNGASPASSVGMLNSGGQNMGSSRTTPVNVYVIALTKDMVLNLDYKRLLNCSNGNSCGNSTETYILHTDILNSDAANKIKSFLGENGYINTLVIDFHRSDYDKMDSKGKEDFFTDLGKGYAGEKTKVLLGMCWAGGRYFAANDRQNLPSLTKNISMQLDKATVYGLKTEANSISFRICGDFGTYNDAYNFESRKWRRYERAFESEWTVTSFNASTGAYIDRDIYKSVRLTTQGEISVTDIIFHSTDIPFK